MPDKTLMAAKSLYSTPEHFASQVHDALAATGVSVRKAAVFNFYFYVGNRTKAEAAAKPIRAAGLSVDVDRAAIGRKWLCLASSKMIPSQKQLIEIGRLFLGLAAKHQGDFDGWELQPEPMDIGDGLLAQLIAKLNAVKEDK